jgi:hypothetical protein
MNFDTMESNISEDMAKKLRKIICNEPRWTRHIKSDGTINWEAIRSGRNSDIMRYLRNS